MQKREVNRKLEGFCDTVILETFATVGDYAKLWMRPTQTGLCHICQKRVSTRRVSFGILPCVRITSLKKNVKMTTNAISDTLRQKESPVKSRRKVVQRISCDIEGHNWVVYLKNSYPRKSIQRELGKLGSPKAPGTKLKFRKERVHREELSKSVRLISVGLARQIRGKIT